jgi:predicted DNA-binding protein (MmcQ/YjbR family)
MAHPRRTVTRPALLKRVRKLCLGLPEASEKEAWGGPTFRVRGQKMFAMYMDNHHGNGRVALWLNAPPGAQDELVESDPERFFVPPYMGARGWIGVQLDRRPDWELVAELVEASYRRVAPRKLLDRL